MNFWNIIGGILALVVAYVGGLPLRRWVEVRRRERETRARTDDPSPFSVLGVSVKIDCRACGQFNRVPGHRLRDKPKCGRCKARLMSGKRIVLCRARPMEGLLCAELDAAWTDEDKLWQRLADHVALENKAEAEKKNPALRVVN